MEKLVISNNNPDSSNLEIQVSTKDSVFQSNDLVSAKDKNDERSIEIESESLFLDEALKSQLRSIPDKMAFKIGEVASLADVKPYVLRYWETEFDAIKPRKSNSNQRMYLKKDVETILVIKKLLHRDRFSIEGARKAIKKMKSELKQNKEIQKLVGKYERATHQVESLSKELRELKSLFK